jgi:hypothetical protein
VVGCSCLVIRHGGCLPLALARKTRSVHARYRTETVLLLLLLLLLVLLLVTEYLLKTSRPRQALNLSLRGLYIVRTHSAARERGRRPIAKSSLSAD